MKPADVYVIYDQRMERIKSVHSSKAFATDELLKLEKETLKDVNLEKGQLSRYTVVDLETCQEWLAFPMTEN